jgi:hypothetical protein
MRQHNLNSDYPQEIVVRTVPFLPLQANGKDIRQQDMSRREQSGALRLRDELASTLQPGWLDSGCFILYSLPRLRVG